MFNSRVPYHEKTTTVQDNDWSKPWFSFDGKCLKKGYLNKTGIKTILNGLTYNPEVEVIRMNNCGESKIDYPLRNMSKEQAFAGLIKPLLDNFRPEELSKCLNDGCLLEFIKDFYKHPYSSLYSRSFGIE